ncbi:MAG: hypothetical protein Ct9H300mP24_8550 [Candidatus Neomarinimicrobiota bacterium]|nr:MAG: hypothetical protein Ct9H300mP24_8550 [Candidatus Neomarinimicrobiota bacterium]
MKDPTSNTSTELSPGFGIYARVLSGLNAGCPVFSISIFVTSVKLSTSYTIDAGLVLTTQYFPSGVNSLVRGPILMEILLLFP